jgi:hypothetical protein
MVQGRFLESDQLLVCHLQPRACHWNIDCPFILWIGDCQTFFGRLA